MQRHVHCTAYILYIHMVVECDTNMSFMNDTFVEFDFIIICYRYPTLAPLRMQIGVRPDLTVYNV